MPRRGRGGPGAYRHDRRFEVTVGGGNPLERKAESVGARASPGVKVRVVGLCEVDHLRVVPEVQVAQLGMGVDAEAEVEHAQSLELAIHGALARLEGGGLQQHKGDIGPAVIYQRERRRRMDERGQIQLRGGSVRVQAHLHMRMRCTRGPRPNKDFACQSLM